MRAKYLLLLLPLTLVVCNGSGDGPVDSQLETIDIYQVTSQGERFFIASENLSLYANDPYSHAMRGLFFSKAQANFAYDTIPCPAGITTTCGQVTFVSVNAANVP